MRIQLLKNLDLINEIGPDKIGRDIMLNKAEVLFFKIEKLNKIALNILKQDALSLNADLITPRDAILSAKENYDCILIGSVKSLKLLSKKLQIQPFGLKEIGKDIRAFLKIPLNLDSNKKQIMAIVNINSDSFHTEFKSDIEAIDYIYQLIDKNIDIIDIGAVSTKPNSKLVDYKTELKRLENIFSEIKTNNIKACFSIDTYNPEVAHAALQHGFKIVNDISGSVDGMLPILKEYKNIYYVLTHIKGRPENMQQNCQYESVVLDIDRYFQDRIKILNDGGFYNIILDVGIGFAKDLKQNIDLVRNLKHFARFDRPLLVGLSSKSMIKSILSNDGLNLDEENIKIASLIAGIEAFKNGADILRVHSVQEYSVALSILKALR